MSRRTPSPAGPEAEDLRSGAGRVSRRRGRWVAVGLGLSTSLVVLGVWLAGGLEGLEGVAVDTWFRLRGRGEVDPRVAVVALDGESLDRYGRWPWRRDLTAELVTRLAAAGARVIALDMVFSEPSRHDEAVDLSAEDAALAAAIARAGNVVLGYFFRGSLRGRGSPPPAVEATPPPSPFRRVTEPPGGRFRIPSRRQVEPNLDLFATASSSQGFYDQRPESGVHRHYALVAEYRGFFYPALALAAVAQTLEEPLDLTYHHGDLPEVRLGGRGIPTDEAGELWINYRGPAGTVPQISAARVLAGNLPAGALVGQLVFVGFTEPGLGEIYTSPFGTEITGVEVHAQVADNLLADRYLRDTGVEAQASLAAVLLMGPGVALLAVAIRRHLVGSAVAIAAVLLWPAASYAAFRWGGRHLEVAAPVLAGLGALVISLRYQIGWVERISRQLQKYVSPAVAEEVRSDPVLQEPRRAEVTVLFCDLQGFTRLSEHRDPQELAAILERFFTPMTALVLDHGGTLDKYMGDALMAFFGAPGRQPDHAERACRAALAMVRGLGRVNARFRAEGLLPPGAPGLGMGVGLNSGEVSVGNMGSEQVFDYTVLGDAVNLGSRLEGLTRRYEAGIVVSEPTCRAAGEGFLFRRLDRVRVKGKEEPVTIFELLAERPRPGAAPEGWEGLCRRVERFEAGFAAYQERRFAAAAEIFAALAAEGRDGPSEVFLARCRTFERQPPPADWDGVERWMSK